jgi:hypothetical protein
LKFGTGLTIQEITGGFASSRFHRPPSGLGLSKTSINCFKSVRKIETIVKFWEVMPRMELLIENKQGEAYISAKEGEYYLIYFTNKGSVKLDIEKQKGNFTIKWLSLKNAEWTGQEEIKAGSMIDLKAKSKNGCIAVLYRKKT